MVQMFRRPSNRNLPPLVFWRTNASLTCCGTDEALHSTKAKATKRANTLKFILELVFLQTNLLENCRFCDE